MKKIIKSLENEAGEFYEVGCSSDPASLDGIVFKCREKQFALLDGTSPHSREAMMIGASEELIDLGEGVDRIALSSRKEEIRELNSKKKAAYSRAYGMLRAAGEIYNEYFDLFLRERGNNEAECLVDEFQTDEKTANKSEISLKIPSKFLINSFSKYGYSAYNENSAFGVKTLCVGKACPEGFVKMKAYAEGKKESVRAIIPSPLSDNLIEGILTDNYLYYLKGFGDFPYSDTIKNKYSDCLSSALSLAQMELSEASEIHFALEKIYTKNTCFDNRDRILKDILNLIYSI